MTQVHTDKYSATSAEDFIDKIVEIAVAAGWTLYDDLRSGSPYAVVLKSTGESGTERPAYFYLKKSSTTNRIDYKIHMFWDNSAHTGTYATSSGYQFLSCSWTVTFDCYVTANKDALLFAALDSAKWNFSGIYLFEPITNDALGTLQSGVSAAEPAVCQLASGEANGFEVGGTYQIVDDDNRQAVVVSAVDTGTHQITIEDLNYDFSAGAVVGNSPYRWVTHVGLYQQINSPVRWGRNGSGDESSNCTINNGVIATACIDPDNRSHGKYVLFPALLYDNEGVFGFPAENALHMFCDLNSTLNEHTLSVGDIDNGTSSGSNTSTTLNDTGKSWSTDEHADKCLIITAGTGAGQMRKITSNTGTELTIPAWTSTPDGTSEYTICEEGWMYFYFNNQASLAGALRIE